MAEVPAAAPPTQGIIHDEIRVLPGPPPQYPTPPATIHPTASSEPELAKSPSPGLESEDDEPEETQQSSQASAKAPRKQKPPPPPLRVSERSGKGEHTPRYGQFAVAKLAQSSNPDDEEEPTTYQEATTHPT